MGLGVLSNVGLHGGNAVDLVHERHHMGVLGERTRGYNAVEALHAYAMR